MKMELNEALERLKNAGLIVEGSMRLDANGFILEGAYRDLIHQKIGEIRLNKKESENRVTQAKRKAAKVLRTVYKECKEFVDDLCNELVTDKIKLSKNTNDNYNKIIISTGTQIIGIIVKDDELVYIRDGYNEDNLSMDKVDKDSLSNFLNKVFDDVTYYAAQAY